MNARSALDLVALLQCAGADFWIGGGWGIDALLGRQTRPHRDLDVCHRHEHEPRVVEALAGRGFTETHDLRPVRFVWSYPDGREIDLHPLVFAEDGSAIQASPDVDVPFEYPARCFVSGKIDGVTVPCLSAEQQVYFHQGYEPTDRDPHDMAMLREEVADPGDEG
jgi:lincosamide nucleotidyltransferase A/C/D/E